MSGFAIPALALRAKGLERVEWPPKSGRVADYNADEVHLMRALGALMRAETHRDGCGSRTRDGLFDLACPRCALANEVTLLHEAKCEFAGVLVDDYPDGGQ